MKNLTINRLTPRQERFCREYLIDLNATQAYRRAGFNSPAASAGPNACRLLKKDKIKKRITELQQERAERTKISADKVLEEIGRLAFMNIKAFAEWDEEGKVTIMPSSEISDAQAAGIADIKSTTKSYIEKATGNKVTEAKVEVKFHNKADMLRLAYSHLGLNETDKDKATDLEKMLMAAEKRIKGGTTFFVHNKDKGGSDKVENK